MTVWQRSSRQGNDLRPGGVAAGTERAIRPAPYKPSRGSAAPRGTEGGAVQAPPSAYLTACGGAPDRPLRSGRYLARYWNAP
jgi:hypothetical protein